MNHMQDKQKFFIICGIAAPILFLILVIIGSLSRPDYSQFSNFISDLGVGPNAILQNVSFIVFGILIIMFTFGMRAGLPILQGRSSKTGVWLVLVSGLGIMGAGIFPEDVFFGIPHGLVSATAFVSIIAAQLLIWRGLKDTDPSVWANYRTYCLVSGLLSAVLVIVLNVAISDSSDYQGLAQRAFLAVPLIWVEATALKLYFM
jgi:hypothetical membrane protein